MFRSEPDAQALRAWSDAELVSIADALVPVWRSWLADWSAAGNASEARIDASRAHECEAASREWQPLGTCQGAGAWLAGGDEQAQRVVHWLLFAELPASRGESRAGMASSICAKACFELISHFRTRLGVIQDPSQPPAGPQLWHGWSGAIELVLACEDAELHLLLDAGCVAALRGELPRGRATHPAEPLVPLPQALRSQRVGLSANLDPIDIHLGALAQLRPGDILPLSHALDADIALVDANGRRVFGGFLGRTGDRRALQLSS